MYRIHQSSRALPHGVQRLTGVRTAVVSSLSSSPPAESVLRSRRFHRVRRSNSHQQQDRQLHTQAASSASSSTYMDLFGVQRSSHFSARPPDRDSTQHDKEGQEQQQREDVEEDELNHDIDTSVVLHDLSRVFAGLSLVLQQTAALTVSRARDSTAQVQQAVQTNGRGLEQVVRGVAASTLGVGSKALPSLPSRLSDAHGFASRVVDVVGEQIQRGVSGKDGVKMGTIDPAEVQRKVERTMNQFSKEASAIQRSLKSALDGTLEKRPELRGVVEEVGKHVNKAGEEVNKIMRRAQQQNGQQGSEEGFSTRDHASTAGMIRRTDSQTSEVNERIANTAAQDYDNDSSGNPTPLSPKMAASAAAEALARQESAARSDRPTSSESLPPPLSAAELAAAKRATTLAGVSRTSTFTTSKPPSQTAPTPAASSPSASAHQSTKSITPPAPGVAATPVIPFVVARDTSASNVKSASAPENAQFASNSTNDGTKSATSEAALPPASSSNSSSSASSPPKAGSAPSSGNNFSHSSFSDSFRPRERTVPSSPLARIAGFSQIASSIVLGTIKDKITGAFSGAPAGGNTKEEEQAAQRQQSGTQPGASAANGGQSSTASPNAGSKTVMGSFLSEANTERLAEGLCRMRGAALKVGQMLSIADDSMVPPQLQAVLDRVRDGADVMPRHQLERALYTELGPNWQDQLSEFDWQPMAAASIGQVHRARLKSNGMEVVMKVQYPGVAESINSDVNNLKRLIRFVNVLPKGMYIDETMRAAKEELALECDYSNEALAQKKFKHLIQGDKAFYVPSVIDSMSTKRILTTERIYGCALDRLEPTPSNPSDAAKAHGAHDKVHVSEQVRNSICKSMLRLCLTELFSFRFMQTDPNWSNFLYDVVNHRINLIDFGASRLYRKEFVDEYLRLVYACAQRDRKGLIESNIKLGFLTGDETKEYLDATVQAGFIVGEPFASEVPYDFVEGNLAARVSAFAPILLKDRLTAPPKDAYTLHRKLSGAFLTCRKLGAKVQCRDDFLRVYKNHQFGPELPLVFCAASKDPIESRLTPA